MKLPSAAYVRAIEDPHITRHDEPQGPCDGIKWGEVPLKALYRWGPSDENGRKVNDPLGLDNYRCSKQGRWSSDRFDGVFCWMHLRVAIRNWLYENLQKEW